MLSRRKDFSDFLSIFRFLKNYQNVEFSWISLCCFFIFNKTLQFHYIIHELCFRRNFNSFFCLFFKILKVERFVNFFAKFASFFWHFFLMKTFYKSIFLRVMYAALFIFINIRSMIVFLTFYALFYFAISFIIFHYFYVWFYDYY